MFVVSMLKRIKNNGQKLQQGSVRIDVGKSFLNLRTVKLWKRLPEKQPSLETFNYRLNKLLSRLTWMSLILSWDSRSGKD